MSSKISKDGSFPWPCCQCQDCQRQKECPYVYDQMVCQAARQGREMAQGLTKEADRLLEAISNANDIRCLLDGSRDLEQALTCGLSSEMAVIDGLDTQAAKFCQ